MFDRWRRSKDLKVREIASTLSGTKLEDQLAQYGAVYGEVLLGMHRELQRARVDIEQQQVNAYAYESEMKLLRRELEQLKGEPRNNLETKAPQRTASSVTVTRVTATAALLVGLVALLLTLLT